MRIQFCGILHVLRVLVLEDGVREHTVAICLMRTGYISCGIGIGYVLICWRCEIVALWWWVLVVSCYSYWWTWRPVCKALSHRAYSCLETVDATPRCYCQSFPATQGCGPYRLWLAPKAGVGAVLPVFNVLELKSWKTQDIKK
jgi:hypothetical protein